MTNEQFLYWLQGMLEYTNINSLSEKDIRAKLHGIKDHLALVFEKKTPDVKQPEKKGVIEPSPDLKKMFEEAARQARENPKPSARPLPSYTPMPGTDPRYWLEQPSFQLQTDKWHPGYDMKPGVLYC